MSTISSGYSRPEQTLLVKILNQWESLCPFDPKKKKMILFDFGLGSLIVSLEPKQTRILFYTAVPVQQSS